MWRTVAGDCPQEPLYTTIPVLTEAFQLLTPASRGADQLREFILRGGARVWYMNSQALQRAFQLMHQYSDHPMDLADASLLAAMESLRTKRVFTLDQRDFSSNRIRLGHRLYALEIIN
ncbi:MAG: PIN domain-containing protein [Acidobacteriota bacterium]